MEVEDAGRRRWVGLGLLCVWGLVMAGGLTSLLIYAAGRSAAAPESERSYHLWFALVAVALLAMTLVVWAWMLAHRISARSGESKRRGRTKYINAWELAGKRFRLDDEDDEPEDDQDQPPDAGP